MVLIIETSAPSLTGNRDFAANTRGSFLLVADHQTWAVDYLLIRFGEPYPLDTFKTAASAKERPLRPNFFSLLQAAPVRQKWKCSQFTSTGHITMGLQNPFPHLYSVHNSASADGDKACNGEQPATIQQTAKLPTKQELSAASQAQLTNLRRQFAMQNHPDRVSGNNRDAATEIMANLNRLIDDELNRRNGK